MMDTEQITRSDRIEADLNYAAPMDYSPEAFVAAPGGDPATRVRSNLKIEQHRVTILDGGGSPSATNLDREGYVLLHRPTAVTDFRDQAQIKDIYLPELRDLLTETMAADFVAFPFVDGTYRSTNPKPGDSGPAPSVHVDYTANGMLAYLDRAFPDRPKDVRRWAVFNLWRMLTPTGPVDVPLAMLDARTLDAADKVPVVTHFHDIGSVESMSLRYNPDHRWTFFSRMRRDDMLVFKTYDSDPATYFPVGHTAFRDPMPGTQSRRSFETRAYVCWYR